MKLHICNDLPDGTVDSWTVEFDTVEELQEAAKAITELREKAKALDKGYQLTNYELKEIDND